MTSADAWKSLYTAWPAGVPRRGVLVTTLNETIPFKGFMVKDSTVLLERSNPDPFGVRFILIGFDAINTVKFIDPLKESVFAAAGYVGKFAKE